MSDKIRDMVADMKIVNVHYTGFGGVAGVVHGLVTAPGAEACEWVMAYYGVAPLDSSHAAFCENQGFEYAVFQPRPQNPWAAWHKLASWLIREKPSAIICHSSTAIPPCSWASRSMHIPLIAVEHTPNEVKSKTEWLGSLAAMLLADRVVLLTDTYKELLAAHLGPAYNRSKVSVISNGVSVNAYYPSSNTSSRTLRAGMAARMSATKRHDLLIDISHELGLVLELAGDGECMPSLVEKVNAQAVSNVSFFGLISEAEMPTWLRSLDLYLHASSGETFSMSILQAMATGLPIIASDISGMDEIIGNDGECGLLVPNTVDAWRNAVLRLIKNPVLRRQMGAAARKRALSLFSSQMMLKSYLDVCHETINL